MRICVGIDAAKTVHRAVGIDDGGRVLRDRAVDNTPQAIAALIARVRTVQAGVVIGIDVVGSFARFLEASLLAGGFALVHTPGIAVNRAGQGFAGGGRQSGPREARTIAELVRTRGPFLPTMIPALRGASKWGGGANRCRIRGAPLTSQVIDAALALSADDLLAWSDSPWISGLRNRQQALIEQCKQQEDGCRIIPLATAGDGRCGP